MLAHLTGKFGRKRSLILIGVQLLLVIALLKAIAGFREPEYGFSQLIMFGSGFAERALPEIREIPHAVVENSPGYDGQFYAQMAMDPLIRDPNLPGAMDSPEYRFRRILMPMAAYLAGFGQPVRIVQAIALINVLPCRMVRRSC